jgi:hypothetical protein
MSDFLKKLDGIMQDSDSFLALRGQVTALKQKTSKDGEVFYLLFLKVIDNFRGNKYGQVNCNYCITFSTDFLNSKKLKIEDIQSFKFNEIICTVNVCNFSKEQKNKDGEVYFINNVSYYLTDIMQLNSLDSTVKFVNVVNL